MTLDGVQEFDIVRLFGNSREPTENSDREHYLINLINGRVRDFNKDYIELSDNNITEYHRETEESIKYRCKIYNLDTNEYLKMYYEMVVK